MSSDSNAALRVWRSVFGGDLGEVRRGIESGVSVNWKNEDEMDRTFLHLAASEGRIHVMKYLLEKRAKVDALDEDDATPLHRAAKSGRVEAVEILLDHKASVNARDYTGNTPLHLAAKKNLAACAIALLARGAIKDAENSEGKACYELCTDANVREAILRFGEEEEEETDEAGRPLPKRRSCWNCGKSASNRCTACRVANYCSADCQKRQWKEHKEECAKLKKSNAEALRVFSLASLDPDARARVEAANEIPRVLVENPQHLFGLLNALHFLTGKVYSTRHTLTGRKLITVPTSVQEEVALAFFSAENEARLVEDGDPKMMFEVDKNSRKRNVFRAERRDGSQTLAVKVLQFKDQRQKVLYLREIRIVSENKGCSELMQFMGCYKAANKFWLLTEWISGGTLKEALDIRPLTGPELLLVAWSLLRALDVLHRRNIVHRDVKPSNVMTDGTGQVKLIDFGLCAENTEGVLTRMVGSCFYMPPEMVLRLPYSFPVDLFSLGLTLLTVANGGKTAFSDPLAAMFMVAAAPVSEHCTLSASCPPALASLIWSMLIRNPFERPTCSELLARHDVWASVDQSVAVSSLSSLWPIDTTVIRRAAKDFDQSNARELQSEPTGTLLDDDLPIFASEAQPQFDDVD